MSESLDPASVWTRFAEHYDEVIPRTRCYRQLVSQIVNVCEERELVVDAGCGTGLVSAELLRHGHWIAGFDRSGMMLERAIARQRSLPSEWQGRWVLMGGDVTQWPREIPQQADAVVMNNVLFCVQDVAGALAEAYRHLRPGGRIVVSGPRRMPNLDHIFDRTIEDMKKDGVYSSQLEHSLQVTYNFQKSVASPMEMPSVFETHEIIAKLKEAGFKDVLIESDQEYYGESFLVAMEK